MVLHRCFLTVNNYAAGSANNRQKPVYGTSFKELQCAFNTELQLRAIKSRIHPMNSCKIRDDHRLVDTQQNFNDVPSLFSAQISDFIVTHRRYKGNL